MNIKKKLKNSKITLGVLSFFRRLFRSNVIKKQRGNLVKMCGGGNVKRARISVKGKGNSILIDTPVYGENLSIFVLGNNNRINILKGCVLKNLNIWIEDDDNEVFIGKNTLICGRTKLSCIEGKKIIIGEGCMFSDNIEVRTGDSHSILDENGRRINPSFDVKIDNHVWVGHGATILKGVHILENCIIGTQAVVTKSFDEKGIVLAGNPARKVKENISWDVKRLPIEDANE